MVGPPILKQGNYNRAIAYFDKVLKIEPSNGEVYGTRGFAYKLKGYKHKAIADFKKALELTNNPNMRQQVQQQLRKLGVNLSQK